MSDFTAAMNKMRAALDRAARAPGYHNGHDEHGGHDEAPPAASRPPAAGVSPREELATQFVRELEALGGRAVLVPSIEAAVDAVTGLTQTLKLRSVAIGDGATIDPRKLSEALSRANVAVFSVAQVPEQRRGELRNRLAACDAGIVEADYAVAQSGTLVFVPTPGRPRSLSLVPPVSIALLSTDYVVPNLAALMAALGSEAVAENPIVFATGPSRTADIEKRIVKGVHGPKALHAVLIQAAQG